MKTFIEFLKESPIPDDWDSAKLIKKDNSFKNIIKYVKEKAKSIGQGASRVAFVVPFQGRKTVIKVAKNKFGIKQNISEIDTLNDWYLKDTGLFIPMIDYDKDEDQPSWIQTEYASPVTEQQIANYFGFGDFSKFQSFLSNLIGFHRNKITPKRFMELYPDDLTDEQSQLQDWIGNFGIKSIDNHKKNWGLFQNRVVMIDAGFNRSG